MRPPRAPRPPPRRSPAAPAPGRRRRGRLALGLVHAARVDEEERPSVPLAVDLLAVARDAGLLVHHRLARPRSIGSRASTCRRSDSRPPRPSVVSSAGRRTELDDLARPTSSTPSAVVSSSTASGAGLRGEASRERSCSSRIAWSDRTTRQSAPSSAARRRARSSESAVRKTLSSASGATTVPMSRPSATQSPTASRLALLVDERAANPLVRRRRATPPRRPRASGSHRSRRARRRRTRSPTSRLIAAALTAGGSPVSSADSATARYMAPSRGT